MGIELLVDDTLYITRNGFSIMPPADQKRRKFLKAGSVALTGVLTAGCTDQFSSNPERSSPTPTDESPVFRTETPTETEEPADISEIQEDLEEALTEQDTGDIYHLDGASGGISVPDTPGSLQRRFEWSSNGYSWWVELEFSRALAEYYDDRFGRSPSFDLYVSDPFSDEYIEFLANQFNDFQAEHDLSEWEKVDLAMAFVQQLRYTPDDVSTGYDQYTYYPAETLIERGGDCEDSTILMAALLRELGYGCVLLGLFEAEHMALGVLGDSSISGAYYEYQGDRYYYVETTGDGNEVGEIPPHYENTNAQIIEIRNHPVILHDWTSNVVDNSTLAIDVSLYNASEVTARNVEFTVNLENRLEQPRTGGTAQINSLSPETSSVERITLNPPSDETLQFATALTVNDELHDLQRSDWHQPS